MDDHSFFCALLCSACSTTCCCIAVWTVESDSDFLRPICRNRLCLSGLGISRQTVFNLEFPSPHITVVSPRGTPILSHMRLSISQTTTINWTIQTLSSARKARSKITETLFYLIFRKNICKHCGSGWDGSK